MKWFCQSVQGIPKTKYKGTTGDRPARFLLLSFMSEKDMKSKLLRILRNKVQEQTSQELACYCH